MPIDSRTRLVTLLGYPLGHSISPAIHNTSFQTQGINMAYLCLPVPSSDLATALQGLRALRFVGSNVTIPHKQAIHALVDEVSEQARAVGAVNTVVSRFGSEGEVVGLYGDNTDVRGFLDPIHDFDDRLEGAEMVVLGSGGAARAVIYALLTAYAPARLTIAARTPGKADRLARDLSSYDPGGALCVKELAAAREAVRSCRLFVNTTPLGMHPYEESSPWEHLEDFGDQLLVYDLVYNPLTTRLMRDARRRGAAVLGGLEMLVRQAAASYIQWTESEMPLDAARQAALDALG